MWCTRLKTFKMLYFLRRQNFYEFLKTLRKVTSDLKNVPGVKLRPNMRLFWTWTVRLYPTEQVQSILQPEIYTHFACFGLSLTPLSTIFKIYSHFSENAVFEKFVKILSPQKFQFLSVSQYGAPRCSHARSKLIEHFVKERVFPKRNAFFFKFFFFFFFALISEHYQIANLNCRQTKVHEHATIL